jgi:hypothetical protein
VSDRGHLKAMLLANIVGSIMILGAMYWIIAGLEDETPSSTNRSRMTAPASEP